MEYANHGITEAQEVADNIAIDLRRRDLPETMAEARRIVRAMLPDETMTVIDNTAEALLQRSRYK